MKKILLLSIIFLFLLSSCKKFIQQGEKPAELDKEIPYKSGKVFFEEEKLELKYVSVENYIRKDSDDIIFYLHGINRSELEWIEENGFGKMFYNVLKENPDLKSYTVISITLGGTYLFIEGAPSPYNTDLETFFFKKIVPYFKEKYSKKGNIYLIGHSLGGFNALILGLRNPDKIKAISVFSPYVAPISPFSKDFENKGKELKMPDFQVAVLKSMLTNAYKTEEKWNDYNPFVLLNKNTNFPYIALSDAKNDLPGFEWSIDNFNKELEKKRIEHSFCKSEGDHRTTCNYTIYNFLKKISSF